VKRGYGYTMLMFSGYVKVINYHGSVKNEGANVQVEMCKIE
jgi:hypothetical protein